MLIRHKHVNVGTLGVKQQAPAVQPLGDPLPLTALSATVCRDPSVLGDTRQSRDQVCGHCGYRGRDFSLYTVQETVRRQLGW